jgi:hypothetical protein
MPTVEVHEGEGPAGADRVVLTWPDHTIANQWLEVTLEANATTGLAAPDVFYFGNAIGETGDSAAHARVDATDVLLTRNDPHPFFDPADVNCRYDFDRDGRVDANDILIARNNQTTYFTELKLLDLTAGNDAKSAASETAKSADSQAADSQAAESQAADSQAAESQAADSQAAESQAAESQAAESQAAGSGKSTGIEGVESAPASRPASASVTASSRPTREAAHDAILAETTPQPSSARTSRSPASDWLHDYTLPTRKPRSTNHAALQTAIDHLLRTDRR